ncbi:hypothetical protein [Ekhidna sp. To15]|uniref:hypothetical protein n=1 Tax=Ekhidna sp. To15 TaxID=3395267 RepID=UPI003F523C18
MTSLISTWDIIGDEKREKISNVNPTRNTESLAVNKDGIASLKLVRISETITVVSLYTVKILKINQKSKFLVLRNCDVDQMSIVYF